MRPTINKSHCKIFLNARTLWFCPCCVLSSIRPCSICVLHVILSRYASLWVCCTSFRRNICPCMRVLPWFCPRYTSLLPISLNVLQMTKSIILFLQQFSATRPRVSLNIKGVNFSPVTNVYKTIRPTG